MKLSVDGCREGDLTQTLCWPLSKEGFSYISDKKRTLEIIQLNIYWPACYVPGTGLGSDDTESKPLEK